MTQQSLTPDEKFLVRAFQTARASGDPYQTIGIAFIAKSIGQKETATKNIVKHLAGANFVQKEEEGCISLTAGGCALAARLLNEED